MECLGRCAVAFLVVTIIAGCDCSDCGGTRVEVIDAETGEVVEGARIAYAESIYAPRLRATDSLPTGEYNVWVRADGYRDWYGEVEVPVVCADIETNQCPDRVHTIEVEPR
jgi:hypothetical protein